MLAPDQGGPLAQVDPCWHPPSILFSTPHPPRCAVFSVPGQNTLFGDKALHCGTGRNRRGKGNTTPWLFSKKARCVEAIFCTLNGMCSLNRHRGINHSHRPLGRGGKWWNINLTWTDMFRIISRKRHGAGVGNTCWSRATVRRDYTAPGSRPASPPLESPHKSEHMRACVCLCTVCVFVCVNEYYACED